MKDTKIINIISKTYFIIVSFLSFIFLFLTSSFIVLQHGLYLDNLTFSNIIIKNAYIKWNDKLDVSIKEIKILKTESKSKKSSLQEINNYIKLASQALELTNSIIIEKIDLGDTNISFKHNLNNNGFFHIKSLQTTLDVYFKFRDHYLIANIDKLSDFKHNLDANGTIILDTYKKELFSKINIVINNDANLTLSSISNNKKTTYSVKSHKEIGDIKSIIALFSLPKEIKYWTQDAIETSNLTINSIKGFVNYADIKNAYKNIHILATANKLNYTYNPNLDAIHTEKTILEFSKGILYIKPQEPYSYGMYLNKSWLKIDFTKKEELLSLYLIFDGMLNTDMLHILNTYKIKLPFLQHSGSIQTNMNINVNLQTIKVDAKGSFFTKKANFDYLGLNLNISDTFITLDNYDVNVTSMKAQYKDIASADVKVNYNAKKSLGEIKFKINKIQFDTTKYLYLKDKPLDVTYEITPNGDKIILNKSTWMINSNLVTLDEAVLPFDLKKLQLSVPTTYFSAGKVANGYVTGTADIKNGTSNLNVDLLKFALQGIKLSQSNTEFNLRYNKYLSISSLADIFFTVNGSEYKVKKLQVDVKKDKIYLKHTSLNIGKFISTKVYANYNYKENKAHISLNDFLLINPKIDKVLYKNSKIMLSVQMNKDEIKIDSKELNANFISKNNGWILNLDSIGAIANNSDFLKKYDITNGKISLHKNSDEPYTKFDGNINYAYQLLTDKDKPVLTYKINGYITKQQDVYIKVNDKTNIEISNNLKIDMHDSGINLDQLLQFVKMLTSQKKYKNDKKMNVFFNATNSYLYVGTNRYVLSDNIDLQFYNGIITAQLSHASGKAGFKLADNEFHLYGRDFNDKFMDSLFSLSQFHGGNLDFSMHGTLDDYSGTFYVKNTTIQDYVLLNNILAFVNTVPSLATFSLPGYNKTGLYVDSAYVNFHAKNHLFNISDIYLDSKEIKILGKGTASAKYNNIDLTLNLKTDLGSNLSQVPVVGYILFDGSSISTTLKIDGKLNNPNVKSMIARDIAVAPLNIILRTITLPYKLLKGSIDLLENNTSKDNTK